ncbi:MAG: restriction endonuclease subunit S [Clostridia bacterium]|nr:restriction endonuclease subunit S [Clostridia bacterium]
MKKSLCEISNPKQWKTISTDMLTETGYPVYGANGIIGYYSTYNHDCETLLITCRGATCGSLNICQPFSYVNGNAMALDSLSADIDIRYLYYYLLNRGLNDVITGSAQPQIVRQSLEKVIVEYPELSIQKSIVETLDKISKIISLRKQQLSKLDELVKSRFIELFGDPFTNQMKWKKIKIEEAVTVEPQNGMYKPQSDYVTDGSGTPILRIDGFYDGVVTDFSSLKRLLCGDKEKQKYLLKEDDIVINRVNSIEYLGKCAHITGLLEETVYESNMMRMHFDSERFNPVYITRLLCSRFLYDQIIGHAKKAVNQASINQKDVLDFDIYQPPIELQNQFAAFVEQTDKSKLEIQKSLEKLETLKKALMQKYFG